MAHQPEKLMPSGHVPAAIFERPQTYGDGKAQSYKIPVPAEVQKDLRRHLEGEVGPKSAFQSWYSADFDAKAQTASASIGSPEIDHKTCWDVFQSMSNALRDVF